MKSLRYLVFFVSILMFINCSTPYQPKGILGGYTDKQLDENCYKVNFWGNQHTRPEDVDKYLLYRCAELAQEKSYDYFVIIEKERDFTKQRQSISGSRQSAGGNNRSRGGVRHNLHWTEYDFNYIIMLCDEVKEIENDTFNAPQILQELADIIDK